MTTTPWIHNFILIKVVSSIELFHMDRKEMLKKHIQEKNFIPNNYRDTKLFKKNTKFFIICPFLD